MTDKQRKEIIDMFNLGIEQVVIPAMDEMKNELLEKLASKVDVEDLKETVEDMQAQLDTIERKIEVQQTRSDEHGKVIDKVKSSPVFAQS